MNYFEVTRLQESFRDPKTSSLRWLYEALAAPPIVEDLKISGFYVSEISNFETS